MKKIVIFLLVTILFVTGCESKYPNLPNDAIGFAPSSFIDVNTDDGYMTITYNERTYIIYGTIKYSVTSKDIDKCIGYIIQDGSMSSIVDLNDKDTRVFTLKEDQNNDYLMVHYVKSELMNQPVFYRAIDTKGKYINTPNYIESLDYKYWK